MRARRRPFAVMALYAFQLVLSLIIAWPIARGLAAAFGGHPRGDAVLFDDGGWALLTLRSAYDRGSPSVWALLTIVTLFGAVVSLVPLAGVLTSISHATPELAAPRPKHLAPYIVVTFRPLLYMLAMGTALELALIAVAAWVFGAVREGLQARYGDARADQLAVISCGIVLLFACAAAVVHDLARAAVVRFRSSTFSAIRVALVTFKRGPLRVFWSWAWRAIASLALVGVVALFVPRFGARPNMAFGSIAAIGLIHQLVVIARVSLRASWLARALRAVDAARPSRL